MENNIETSRALATRIYDLDSEVYRLVGSSLGRTFTGDKETSIRNLTTLISTHPQGHLLRSEIALIGNMARTIRNKEDRSRMMHEYNEILHQIAELPESFGSVDILDQNLASLNTSNLHQKFSKDDHLIICIGRTHGSAGTDIGFALADALKINYYDVEIFNRVLERLEAEKDSVTDRDSFTSKLDQVAKHDTSAKRFLKDFSRYHGLPKKDAVFFNQSDLIVEMAKKEGLDKVYVHCFLDGRDTAPTSGKGFIEELEAKMKEIGVGEIATINGRYYAMDRDNRWDRVEKAYKAITEGVGETADSAVAAIDASYAKDVTDEFVVPTVIMKNGAPTATVQDNDTIIFFNFRPDRAREITRAFCADEFDGFDRGTRKNVTYVCFTEYDGTIPNKTVAFHKVELTNTFGQFLADNGLKQARIAETEKYAHVTFFFNGGVEEPNEGEDRILVKSPKVATYDLKPEMSAPQVCGKLLDAIRSEKYDVIVINFANPDMVGHTGIMEAAIKAIEAVDECVGKTVDAILDVDGQMFICADHGNAEKLLDEDGEPFTAHTTNPVPFVLVNYDEDYTLREGGCLADIVPTMIEMMGMEQPAEMTGKSLLIKK